MYTLTPTTIAENQPMFDAYLLSLTGINDDFWEAHVQESQAYLIELDGQTIGLAGVYQNENLTFFYMPKAMLRHAQPAFAAMLDELKPQYAFVPTNDELFLSLCMDKHKQVEMQAYFFSHGGQAVRPPEYGRECFFLAKPEDEADILDSEGVAENIRRGRYYIMRKDGVFLGQGLLRPQEIMGGAASIGMSVHPEHRQKGVGRSIIMHLADMCRERGLTPICGCWYYNHNSKRTLESAGFVTKIRLLKVWFVDRPMG